MGEKNLIKVFTFLGLLEPRSESTEGGVLSPGQTDRQVVANGRKLNLRRDLRWVAKRTRKFPHKYMRVAERKLFKADYLLSHWLIMG